MISTLSILSTQTLVMVHRAIPDSGRSTSTLFSDIDGYSGTGYATGPILQTDIFQFDRGKK